jgi:hypothetical protein
MYAIVPEKPLLLVYRNSYLAITRFFCEFIKDEMVKEYNGKGAYSAIYSMKPSLGNLKDPGQRV